MAAYRSPEPSFAVRRWPVPSARSAASRVALSAARRRSSAEAARCRRCRTAWRPATPDTDAPWSGAAAIGRRACSSSTPRPSASRTRAASPARPRSRRSDFTARTVLTDLPAGQRIFYRVPFQDLADLRAERAARSGSFVTAPTAAAPRDVTIAWSADTVGQGWGINPDWGGLRLYETMRTRAAGPLHQLRRHHLRRPAGRRRK